MIDTSGDVLGPTLAAFGIEYVVLHRDTLAPEQAAKLERVLAAQLDMVFQDATLIAFQRRGPAGSAVLMQRQGWYPVEHEVMWQSQWTEPQAGVAIQNPLTQPTPVILQWRLQTLTDDQVVILTAQFGAQQAMLSRFVGSPTQRSGQVMFYAPPGLTELSFVTTPRADPQAPTRQLGASFTRLHLTVVDDIGPRVQPTTP